MQPTYRSLIPRLTFILIFLLSVLGLQPAQPVRAATLVVTNTANSGAGSLRQAIADASSGSTITFDASLAGQTIVLASVLAINTNLTVDGSSLSSRINISGNDSVQVFQISPGSIVTFKSLIIKNGKAGVNGGGIHNNAGTLTITDSLFSANHAIANPYLVSTGEGGAVYNQGSLTITNSRFEDNHASRGGAISCEAGSLSINNSTYVSNSAVSDSGGDGGAIYDVCASQIRNSTFQINTAAHYGGAILADSDSAQIEIWNSTFYGNSAVNGGGMSNYGQLSINNSTFSANSSSSGGALRDGIGGVLSLSNSILANSIGTVDCIKSDGAPSVTNSHNLVETTGADLESCGTSLLTTDPGLGTLQDNGGPTQTMALLPGSPALNAGDDASCESNDQRGVSRPQGSHCDLGAYEFRAGFSDVPPSFWGWDYIERLYAAGITSGCGGGNYCPGATVTREQMAVFLVRGKHGSDFVPPPATGVFTDVPAGYWAAPWVEQLALDGITTGCSTNPKKYCPNGSVTREQMAVFLLRIKHDSNYTPPPATGIFQDAPVGYWAAPWIEQLATEGITSGCSVTPKLYCPLAPVTRDQMAVFLVRTFNLP